MGGNELFPVHEMPFSPGEVEMKQRPDASDSEHKKQDHRQNNEDQVQRNDDKQQRDHENLRQNSRTPLARPQVRIVEMLIEHPSLEAIDYPTGTPDMLRIN